MATVASIREIDENGGQQIHLIRRVHRVIYDIVHRVQ